MKPTSRTQRLLDLAKRIAALEDRLRDLHVEFARALNGEENQTPDWALCNARLIRPSRRKYKTQRSVVQAVLDGSEHPLDSYAVAQETKLPLDNVRTLLSKLTDLGSAKRISTGLYITALAKDGREDGSRREGGGSDDPQQPPGSSGGPSEREHGPGRVRDAGEGIDADGTPKG
jgi:hypothetical protein